MPLPKRRYKDDIELSILGFGGIVICGLAQAESDRRVRVAYESGVNYFDCAPYYSDGEAEIKLGESLKPFRSSVFLAEKTMKRDAAGALADLETTLRRFHTECLDLYQFHAVGSLEEVDQILAPGGAAETVYRAQRDGKVRFVGFSAHDPAAAIRLMEALSLDSVLFPVNLNAWRRGGFGPQIMARAKDKGLARMALKALAFGLWPASLAEKDWPYPKCWYQPIDEREMARLALRFTLNQDVTAAIPPGDERIFDLAMELAAEPLPPLDDAELEVLAQYLSAREPVFRAAA